MFLYFDLKQVDITIIEAGIGGRLDSMCSFIKTCHLYFNHTITLKTLGDSLLDIANHKAGGVYEKTHLSAGRVSAEVSISSTKNHMTYKHLQLSLIEIAASRGQSNDPKISYDHWESPSLKLPMLGQHRKQCWASCHYHLAQTFPKITDKCIKGIEET